MDTHHPEVRRRSLSIGIYAVSDALNERRHMALAQGITSLRNSGHVIKVPANLRATDGYAAGSVATRRSALMDLVCDTGIDAFLSAWGGKATIDLFLGSSLDVKALAFGRRPWFGFSDSCVLLNAIAFDTGLITFYGPNVAGKLDQTWHSLMDVARYIAGWPVFGLSSDQLWVPVIPGFAKGRLVGGNLSTFSIAYLSGAFSRELSTAGKVLFFECADEDVRVHRQLLVALSLRGFFDDVTGIVVGHISGGSRARSYIIQSLKEICIAKTIPIYSCATFGHAALENPPIPIGLEVQLGHRPPTLIRNLVDIRGGS
ncbi:LD-carboxypeptidase [Nocardiopsis sp. FR4]|uniref:LD-carboxypeptidase n=1 Tax=Nocardiopsis sp. FR4 TaxID=2605985 RepID=UPI0013580B1D|nr:LD-carboxypeptidase [Nocardiopsis sp. FR4]